MRERYETENNAKRKHHSDQFNQQQSDEPIMRIHVQHSL